MGFKPPSFKEYEDLKEEVDLEGVELGEILLEDEDLVDQDVLLPSQETEVDPENMFPQFSQALPALSQLTPRSNANPRTRVVVRRSSNIPSNKVNRTGRNSPSKKALQSSAIIRKPEISKRSSSVVKENEKTIASTRAKRQKKS
uniref:Uncharacterized protein n=1 Tax=Acrobeloides nanus TaxID=290746 RepID=A0A914DZE0_9BILA